MSIISKGYKLLRICVDIKSLKSPSKAVKRQLRKQVIKHALPLISGTSNISAFISTSGKKARFISK